MSIKKFRREKKSKFSRPTDSSTKVRRQQRNNLHEITRMNVNDIISNCDLEEIEELIEIETDLMTVKPYDEQ